MTSFIHPLGIMGVAHKKDQQIAGLSFYYRGGSSVKLHRNEWPCDIFLLVGVWGEFFNLSKFLKSKCMYIPVLLKM